MKIIKKFYLIFATAVFAVVACNNYKPNVTMSEAIEMGNEKAVQYYLKHGEMVNQKNENGVPLIVLATQNGNISIIKALIKAGAKVNAKDNDGWTALMLASNGEVAQLLINANADIDEQNNRGETALMRASSLGHTDVVKVLLQNKADVSITDNCGGTSLMYASDTLFNEKESVEIVSLLANAGFTNVNAEGCSWVNQAYGIENKTTALILASSRGNANVVKLLISMGADVNQKNSYGETALIEASFLGNIEIVKILLKEGADVNVSSLFGSALSKAKSNGHEEIVNILKHAGAKK